MSLNIIRCPLCGNDVNQSEIIWKFPHEERIADCCFDCENLERPIPRTFVKSDFPQENLEDFIDVDTFINGNRWPL